MYEHLKCTYSEVIEPFLVSAPGRWCICSKVVDIRKNVYFGRNDISL